MDYGLDVLPDLFGNVPAMTQCNETGAIVPLADAAVVKITINGEVVHEEHYANQAIAFLAMVEKFGGIDA